MIKLLYKLMLNFIMRRHMFWLEGRPGGIRLDLSRKVLDQALFMNSCMKGCAFDKSDLRGASFRESNCCNSHADRSKWARSDMSMCDLTNIIFQNSTFSYSDFSFCTMSPSITRKLNINFEDRGLEYARKNLQSIIDRARKTQNLLQLGASGSAVVMSACSKEIETAQKELEKIK